MKNQNKASFATGQILGTKAFNENKKRVPAMDKEVICYIGTNDLNTISLLKGWIVGWDMANIKATINL